MTKLRQSGLSGVRARAAVVVTLWAGGVLAGTAAASEHVVLRNGFAVDCERRVVVGDRVRLYLPTASGSGSGSDNASYMEVAADAVMRVETLPDVPVVQLSIAREAVGPARTATRGTGADGAALALSPAEMHEMLARAGSAHGIDADLLASVVRAESAGRVGAVSRAGARGLMQLMPGTAAELGVTDAFAPEQNISGGTAYLDALLTRYHDDVALALAAYNAGPLAVERWHGVPPYPETRAYVSRVIREFNRRKVLAAAIVIRDR